MGVWTAAWSSGQDVGHVSVARCLFHEQYVRIIDGFSTDDLMRSMRSASRGEPGPAKLCVGPLSVSVALDNVSPALLEDFQECACGGQ